MGAVSSRALPRERSALVRGAGSLRSPRQRPAAPAHGPWSALPAPPAPRPERGAAGGIPAISSAPRGMWPARCPTAERPEVGAGRRGQSQPRLAAAPASPSCSGFPSRRPSSGATRPAFPAAPGLPGAPGLRLLPARLPPEPLPAPRVRPQAAFIPPTLPPRPPRTPAGPQNLSLKPKSALATSPWAKSRSLSKPQFLLL